jgi:hypothetical protein
MMLVTRRKLECKCTKWKRLGCAIYVDQLFLLENVPEGVLTKSSLSTLFKSLGEWANAYVIGDLSLARRGLTEMGGWGPENGVCLWLEGAARDECHAYELR